MADTKSYYVWISVNFFPYIVYKSMPFDAIYRKLMLSFALGIKRKYANMCEFSPQLTKEKHKQSMFVTQIDEKVVSWLDLFLDCVFVCNYDILTCRNYLLLLHWGAEKPNNLFNYVSKSILRTECTQETYLFNHFTHFTSTYL